MKKSLVQLAFIQPISPQYYSEYYTRNPDFGYTCSVIIANILVDQTYTTKSSLGPHEEKFAAQSWWQQSSREIYKVRID